MSDRPFVHLHCHSHYSLLDGAGSIPKLIQRAKDHGMNALALTDHGNLHGALEFYKKAKDKGIKPILGYEAYVAPNSRFERDASSSKEASYHLTLLAQNRTGFRNLVKMASHAYLEGFYFKPRIDRELLERYSEGIICLSGCVSSEFSRALLKGTADESHLKEAMDTAAWFHRVFGDRYFIEIMNNGIEIQRLQLEGAVDIAKKMGLPLVATCDTHYVDREDAEAQDVMLCINTGKFRTDTNRMRMENNSFFLRPPEEMYAHFPGLEDAVARSQEIADTVDIDLELGKRNFPVYTIPEGKSAEDYLRELVLAGLKDRYADSPEYWENGELSKVVMDRVDRELGVINKLGFPNYFLIVWDFVRHARECDVPATARGSGVGALVCFALYLSHVCPIKYDLLFERFLDLNRKEAPDIDIDFCKERRVEIIKYVKEKYGEENVAQIGTFGTLAARAAIKDVGRVLGIPITRVNQITALVPEELGIELDDAIEKAEDLRKLYESDPEVHELLDLARKIEGLARNVGTHAAAVVIADKPLTEYVPLCRVGGKTDIITQWSMGDVEAAGLLKMDFLGLRNLTILSKAVDLIEQTTGKKIDPYKFPLDDKKTFALLCRGETKGIFQLESGGIRDLLQKMKPDHFRDIIATNALYRPGPLEGGMVRDYVEVKHGRQKAEYIHPVCEKILGETNGVMVYQEQVMRILNELGGIELAASYTCIKAISKKKEDLIAKNREQFVKGCLEKGLSEQQAIDFWTMIIKFAGYGFNKCVVGETAIIHAETGERTTVGELFENRRDWVIHSLDESGKLRPRRVTDVVWNGRKRVYQLTTQRGLRITATGNHPIRTLNGWTLLENLKSGDVVAGVEEFEWWQEKTADEQVIHGSSEEGGTATATIQRQSLDCTLMWDTVVAIEPKDVQDTYDLTVNVDHNFVADGLVVHNSHSTAYALIAYMTAYLKAHYPVEFMAALLSGDIPGRNFKSKDALVEHMEDCERMNIPVEPANVNTSGVDFTVGDGKIFFGLSAVKGCGGSAGEAIVAAREKGGPFTDIFDFCERVDITQCGRGSMETLIKAGAMDSFGARRAQLSAVLDRALQAGQSAAADRKSGQKNLFGAFAEEEAKQPAKVVLPDLPEWPERDKLQAEKEVLGFYLTAHPLDEYKQTLQMYCSHTTASVPDVPDRAEIILGGMVGAIKHAHTKNGKPGAPTKYANFDFEDVDGVIRCICWPDGFATTGHLIVPEAILVMRGVVDRRGGDEANIIVNELIPLNELAARYTSGVKVRANIEQHGLDILPRIYEVARAYPGNGKFKLVLALDDGSTVYFGESRKLRVDANEEFRARIDNLLGPGNLQLMVDKPKPQAAQQRREFRPRAPAGA